MADSNPGEFQAVRPTGLERVCVNDLPPPRVVCKPIVIARDQRERNRTSQPSESSDGGRVVRVRDITGKLRIS